MAQDPRIDPQTGAYHADPMWRRYDPRFNSQAPADPSVGLPTSPPSPRLDLPAGPSLPDYTSVPGNGIDYSSDTTTSTYPASSSSSTRSYSSLDNPIVSMAALQNLKKLQNPLYSSDAIPPGADGSFVQSDSTDPNTQLAALQDQRQREMARNLSMVDPGHQAAGMPVGTVAGKFSTGATPADLQDVTTDIMKNPLTSQGMDITAQKDARSKALLQGFLGGQDIRGVDTTTGRPGAPTNSYESAITDPPEVQAAKVARVAATLPLQEIQATQAGQLAVEQAKEKNAGAMNQLLMDFLSKNPNANIKGPNGVSISQPSPASRVAPGSGKATMEQLVAEQAKRRSLENVDMTNNPLTALHQATGIGPSTWDIQAQKDASDAKIAQLQQDLWQRPTPTILPPASGGRGAGPGVAPQPQVVSPGRQRATKALQDNGIPVNESNIRLAMQKLGIQE